ncbi:hypothetical protein niasHS_004462 [Heterodera schachtii]|uniref:14-3-3 domain-containing protein n=1 Tax=Heterodera schachtii TaxID=97005 RepID=A0ABD2JJC9_HETSC
MEELSKDELTFSEPFLCAYKFVLLADFKKATDQVKCALENNATNKLKEINFCTECFKNAANEIRNKIRQIHEISDFEINGSDGDQQAWSLCLKKYREDLEELCKSGILLFQQLIGKTEANSGKIIYQFTIADLFRYKCESICREKYMLSALSAYEGAYEAAKKLSGEDITRIRGGLNFALFLAEVQKNKDKALEITEEVRSAANSALESEKGTAKLGEGALNDIHEFLQFMEENENFWRKCNEN